MSTFEMNKQVIYLYQGSDIMNVAHSHFSVLCNEREGVHSAVAVMHYPLY